ncbi:MAG: hypothetical protein L6Q99_09355 [Planctomycetes bacterium]|nr:hypothetical protein [Planctomycetota bacterium]
MIPFERRGSDRSGEGRDRVRRGAIDPALERPSASDQAARTPNAPAARRSRGLWLVIPIVASIVVLGVQATRLEPIAALQLAFAVLFAIGVGWLVFALATPRRERVVCPDCGDPTLENTSDGLCCRECGWRARETPLDDEFDADELAERLRRRGTLGDPPRRW